MLISIKIPTLIHFASCFLLVSSNLNAEVSTMQNIVNEISQLEDKRDPKCYATATRLENFIYGTPLSDKARFSKNSLQKALVLNIWKIASKNNKNKTINVKVLTDAYKTLFKYTQNQDDDWIINFSNKQKIIIKDIDKKHYGSIAYSLRAIIAVQQEDMLNLDSQLLPLSSKAIQALKQSIDLYTLAVLKKADKDARQLNSYVIDEEQITLTWNSFLHPTHIIQPKNKVLNFKPKALNDLKLTRALIKQKLSSYQAYNNINNQLFSRNLQVYFAKLTWPKDSKEASKFKTIFTETMIYFATDLYKGSQKLALSRGHTYIEEQDVFDFMQIFIPHKIDIFEDAIFFPKLPPHRQVVIESYDMDAFRDGGLHWSYLNYAIESLQANLEPDPFASELIVENIAQFGVLILRLTGEVGKSRGEKHLTTKQFETALKQLQSKINDYSKLDSKTQNKEQFLHSAINSKSAENIFFTDVTDTLGINSMHRSSDWLNRQLRTYLKKSPTTGTITIPPAFGGSGVASEDFNNDGFADILILSGRGNKLYKNIDGKSFKDITKNAGLLWLRPEDNNPGEPRQPLIADINNDGLKDIIITYANDTHRIYKNKGDETFEDMSNIAKLSGKGKISGPAVLIDINNDGLLDIYISYFGDYIIGALPTLKRHNDNGRANELFLNKGNFRFENITQGSGLDNTGWAQALTHTDFNSDGNQDIILGNDFGVNAYYRNNGDGSFTSLTKELGVGKASYTMSLGLSDLNGDFIPDVYVSNIVTMNKDEKYVLPADDTVMKFNPDKLATMRVIEANDLFISEKNQDNNLVYNASELVGRGYSSTGWSWDADFFDYDNDGDDDLYVVNGMNEFNLYSSDNPYYSDPNTLKKKNVYIPVSPKEKNVFFVNDGGMLQNYSEKSGMNILSNSRSASYLDYDNDGDLDVILNNYHQASFLFKNNSEQLQNNWLKVKLIGDVKAGINLDAIGAQLQFTTKSKRHIWRQVSSTTGYMSVHPQEQHIGLGDEKIVHLNIIWPNGDTSKYENITANQRIEIKYGDTNIKVKK